MKTTLQILVILFLFNCNIFSQWQLFNNNDLHTWRWPLAIDASGNSDILLSVDSVLLLSENNGNDWTQLNLSQIKPKSNNDIFDISFVGDHIWAGLADGRIIHSPDKGNNWETQFEDTNVVKFIDYIDMFDEARGIAVGSAISDSTPAPILRTIDSGKTWESMNTKNLLGCFSGDVWRRISFANDSVGLFYITGKGLFKTKNGGKNWQQVNTDAVGAKILKLYDSNYGIIWAYNNVVAKYGVFRTINSGETWDFTELDTTWCLDIEFVPTNPAEIWMCDIGNNLFYSNDSGKTWTNSYTPNNYLRGWDLKIIDGQNGWLLCDDGLLYKFNGLTSITNQDNNLIQTYSLYQNYPNPFNPETTIKFDIPESDFVTLKIYDVLGNEIRTLVNENKSPGSYNVKFNGSGLASGMYIYKLSTSKFTSIKKLLLVK